MRNLLFLAHRIPYPPQKGDKIRSYNILKHLSGQFRIHLGCFFDDPHDARHVPALRRMCADVFCRPITPKLKGLRALKGLVRGQSLTEAIYQDPRMTAWVDAKLRDARIDWAFVFCSAMSPYLAEASSQTPTISDLVDVDSEKWSAYARTASFPFNALYRREHRTLRALERRAVESSVTSLLVSKAEADFLGRAVPGLASKLKYLNNGVDLERFHPKHLFADPFRSGRPAIVFTGMMDYRPNVEAVVWFARHVLPLVRGNRPDIEFWIVGARPSAAVRELSRDPLVRVTGSVDDVRPYIAHAICAVAPLRIARGVQNKVIEAMAMGKPVVATEEAFEGLDASSGKEILVARNAEEFAAKVSELIAGRHPGLGQQARSYAESAHCWPKNLQVLDKIFDQAAGQKCEDYSRIDSLVI